MKAETNVNAGDKWGHTLLIMAVVLGHAEIVRALLDKGADANVKDDNGMTPLMWAAYWGRSDIVRTLMDRNADVNAQAKGGSTALMWAAWGRNTLGIVKVLIAKGADINASNERGETALFRATSTGNKAVVAFLKEHGAKDRRAYRRGKHNKASAKDLSG